MSENSYKFQVNLGGMIELLSDHLYSSPDVYIRELLQNGVDAITGREQIDDGYRNGRQGKLVLKLEEGKSLVFTDNGVGLTEDEIHRFLSIIGESSKRDVETGKILSEYIGRFGIGLLSCFMVTDVITVKTRSSKDGTAHIWHGKPDGTYTIRPLDEEIPVGTQMHLLCKEGCEEYYTREKIEELIRYYGLILPYPVILECDGDTTRLNPEVLPWEKPITSKPEIMAFGKEIFDIDFLDCILLHSDEGGINGVAYILPYSVSRTSRQKHRIFLKNMLLSEDADGLLPDWSVFTKCIINAKNLRPTASRESFYEDGELKAANENIAKCLSDNIKEMAEYDSENFKQFMTVHQFAVKSMACENEDLYRTFIDYFTFHTTFGELTGKQLRKEEYILYCNIEKYRQLSQIFTTQNRLLVNTSYVYDHTLLTWMPEFFDVTVMPVDEDEVGNILEDVSAVELAEGANLVKIASQALEDYGCNVKLKTFKPASASTFYSTNDAKLLLDEINHIKEDEEEGLFDEMLSEFREDFEEEAAATLYINNQNPVIRRLIYLSNEKNSIAAALKIKRVISVLYVQALLMGDYPMRNNELALMNENLLGLIGDLL